MASLLQALWGKFVGKIVASGYQNPQNIAQNCRKYNYKNKQQEVLK
ncbi:hypothetical protein HYU09_02100 [Candidatus Woesearchaeota archaeon]|nr:hypothetical protein [Candidatus Woesearchaeota archaeon]